jgi:hypothetical protein
MLGKLLFMASAEGRPDIIKYMRPKVFFLNLPVFFSREKQTHTRFTHVTHLGIIFLGF